MNVEEIIKYSLDKYNADGIFEQKKIIIFGVNQFLGTIINCLSKYDIVAIFDNDINKHGTFWRINIIEPSRIPIDLYLASNIIVVCASRHFFEMKNQLTEIGFVPENIISLMNIRYLYGLIRDCYESEIKYYLGERIYNELVNNEVILLFPSKSLGDAYLPLMYINLKEYENSNIVVCSDGVKKMLKAVGFKRIILISEYEMICMQKYYAINKTSINNIVYVHPIYLDGRHIDLDAEVMASSGHAFWEYYGDIVWNNGNRTPVAAEIVFAHNAQNVSDLFEENGLVVGRTLVLAPYANSMGELPNIFWIELANIFMHYGFSVCTNVVGREKEIPGTVPLRCEIGDFKEVVRRAGYTVFSRCGLNDIISDVRANKIAIYREKKVFGSFSFFELNDMRKGSIDNEVVQLIFDEIDYRNTIRVIEDIWIKAQVIGEEKWIRLGGDNR